jgi:hypothetical protein
MEIQIVWKMNTAERSLEIVMERVFVKPNPRSVSRYMPLFAVVMVRLIAMSAQLPWKGYLYSMKARVERSLHVRKMRIVVQMSSVFFRKVSVPGLGYAVPNLISVPCIVFRFVAVT